MLDNVKQISQQPATLATFVTLIGRMMYEDKFAGDDLIQFFRDSMS